MPRLLYEYIYVNLWILLVLAMMWAHDQYISVTDGAILMAVAITGLTFVSRKQLRKTGRYKLRKPLE